MSGYTQSPCKIDAKEGGEFSLFNGSITGKITKLTANELCEDWRFKEWDENVYSQVRIQLEAVDSSSTKLTLTQTNIPHADKYGNHGVVPKVEQGWQNFFWLRIQVRAHIYSALHWPLERDSAMWSERGASGVISAREGAGLAGSVARVAATSGWLRRSTGIGDVPLVRERTRCGGLTA